ncbi:hypothetical protein C7271_15020 [filamentous cyanobacterium CCP5]|nr:hypothetical protein C7271_15020 [filamentous cyanobacterium CCP5]
MEAAGIASFRALADAAGVSTWTLRQLRGGAIASIRLADLQSLAQVLGISLPTLVADFSATSDPASKPQIEAIQQEYQRLQQQLQQQQRVLREEFQAEVLNTLESWLLQWPTAAHAASQNPAVPAARLIPLMCPIETLLENWQVEQIAAVGAEIPFDPQQHQLMDGSAEPGDPVRVRYTGYRQKERLLYRAKVSPVNEAGA